MGRTVVTTICSREKDPRPGLIPARVRYVGDHVTFADVVAKNSGVEFYILSGLHGLISADKPIEWYDHLLTKEEMPALVEKVVEQLKNLRESDVTDIVFYTKYTQAWAPYREVLIQACEIARVILHVEEPDSSDHT